MYRYFMLRKEELFQVKKIHVESNPVKMRKELIEELFYELIECVTHYLFL